MPPPVSDRYRLEMRLGRDNDIEEWLATDTSLERPVLIRSLGPESSQERRERFIASVSGAAKTGHPHLSRVFAVEDATGGAYAVCEWTGGASAADRLEADQTVGLEEFLPNASGLAGALAALHESGAVHGQIDLSAISWSVAHPAKLGAFGRETRTDQDGDVRALAAALETALTGSAPGGPAALGEHRWSPEGRRPGSPFRPVGQPRSRRAGEGAHRHPHPPTGATGAAVNLTASPLCGRRARGPGRGSGGAGAALHRWGRDHPHLPHDHRGRQPGDHDHGGHRHHRGPRPGAGGRLRSPSIPSGKAARTTRHSATSSTAVHRRSGGRSDIRTLFRW